MKTLLKKKKERKENKEKEERKFRKHETSVARDGMVKEKILRFGRGRHKLGG